MEKRLRLIALFIGGISLISFALLLQQKFPVATLIPAIYGVGLGALLYFFAPKLARRKAEQEAIQAKVVLGLSRGQLWLRGFSILVVVASAGIFAVWTSIYPPLWFFHTILPIAALGITLGLLAYRGRNLLKSELRSPAIPGNLIPRADDPAEKARKAAEFPLQAALIVGIGLAILMTNTALDSAPAEEQRVPVAGRYIKTSKNSRSYYADLGPLRGGGYTGWPESTGVKVEQAEYEELDPGRSFATLKIKPGFWRLPWIQSAVIENAAKPTGHDSAEAARLLIEEARQNKKPPRPFRAPESYREEKWPNGQKKERVPLVKGREEGIARYWHPNGRLYAEIPWRDGQKDGHFLLYRDDGSVEQDLMYKEGKPHGLLRWYKPDGSLQQEAFYYEGEAR